MADGLEADGRGTSVSADWRLGLVVAGGVLAVVVAWSAQGGFAAGPRARDRLVEGQLITPSVVDGPGAEALYGHVLLRGVERGAVLSRDDVRRGRRLVSVTTTPDQSLGEALGLGLCTAAWAVDTTTPAKPTEEVAGRVVAILPLGAEEGAARRMVVLEARGSARQRTALRQANAVRLDFASSSYRCDAMRRAGAGPWVAGPLRVSRAGAARVRAR